MLWAKMGLLYTRFEQRVTAILEGIPDAGNSSGGAAAIGGVILAAIAAGIYGIAHAMGHDAHP